MSRRRARYRALLVLVLSVFAGGLLLGFWLGRTYSLKVGYAAGRVVEKTRHAPGAP